MICLLINQSRLLFAKQIVENRLFVFWAKLFEKENWVSERIPKDYAIPLFLCGMRREKN